MSTARERLLAVVDYWNSNRQVGHTSLMVNGLSDTKAILVVTTMHEADRFRGPLGLRVITIHQLPESIKGQELPLVVDHHAMSVMIRDALSEK